MLRSGRAGQIEKPPLPTKKVSISLVSQPSQPTQFYLCHIRALYLKQVATSLDFITSSCDRARAHSKLASFK